MTRLERFRHDEAKLHEAIGLVPREVREARAELADCDATRAVGAHRVGALLLLGDPGTGKSLAAARWLLGPSSALANWCTVDTAVEGLRWRYRGPRCLWRTAKALSRVKQYDSGEVEQLVTPGRLVVDDLGAEYLDKGGFLVSLIDEIISERHRRELPTILTANLSPADFGARYGQRVVDRIAEAGVPVVCGGASMRTRKPSALNLRALVTDSDVEARHASLIAERAARDAADVARWEEDRRKFKAELDARANAPRHGAVTALAASKTVEPVESADQVAVRENEARRDVERQLAERARGQS
jgi:hypothetical protein